MLGPSDRAEDQGCAPTLASGPPANRPVPLREMLQDHERLPLPSLCYSCCLQPCPLRHGYHGQRVCLRLYVPAPSESWHWAPCFLGPLVGPLWLFPGSVLTERPFHPNQQRATCATIRSCGFSGDMWPHLYQPWPGVAVWASLLLLRGLRHGEG